MRDVDIGNDPYREMKRVYRAPEKRNRAPEERFDPFLPFVSLAVTISVMLGLASVLDGSGVMQKALVLFLGLMAGALSFQANKAAFQIGSKLAAAGDILAIALVIGWFFIMATVVGTIRFAGVSRDLVEGARLREPIHEISRAGRLASEATTAAKDVLPLITAGASDLASIASCEAQIGCVSGRRGRGSEVAALEALAAKFRDVTNLYSKSERNRSDLVKRLDGLGSKYEAQLSRGGVSGEGRATLLGIYAEAQTLVTAIANAMPTSATRGLVSELRGLQASPAKPGRIDVAARLRGHAARLEQAISGIEQSSITLPPFPAPSGIAVGWHRLDLSWPLATLLFGLELILIVLWLLLVLDFRARRRSIDVDHDDDHLSPSAGAVAAVSGRRGPAAPQTDRRNGAGL